ncbi:hypothetical protein EBZ38_01245 [bacterium]|nr:hypothetical protein [bacterium]NBX97484.1 hypothetical protein [bacterium]NDD82894.1 hypothetical protein [bacterium]
MQAEIFNNKVKRNIPVIFKEAWYAFGLIILAGVIGYLIVGTMVAKRSNPNSIETDTLVLYLFQFLALLTAISINALNQRKVARYIDNQSRAPQIVAIFGIVFFIISLLTATGLIYQYGYLKTQEQKKYEDLRLLEERLDSNKIEENNLEFEQDKRDWYIISNNQSTNYILVKRFYSQPYEINTKSLRSKYKSTTGEGISFQITQTNEGIRKSMVCVSDDINCKIINTKLGKSKCINLSSRLSCELNTKEGEIVQFLLDSGSQYIDPIPVYDALVKMKWSDVELTL